MSARDLAKIGEMILHDGQFNGETIVSGDGGNVIYVNREEGVAVGVTGTFKPRIFDRVEFIEKHVLPLV